MPFSHFPQSFRTLPLEAAKLEQITLAFVTTSISTSYQLSAGKQYKWRGDEEMLDPAILTTQARSPPTKALLDITDCVSGPA